MEKADSIPVNFQSGFRPDTPFNSGSFLGRAPTTLLNRCARCTLVNSSPAARSRASA